MDRADQDWVEPVGAGQATCLLVESAEQAYWGRYLAQEVDEARRLQRQRFDNICALARAVPCYLLHLGLSGPFWERIEEALNGDGMCRT